MARKLETYAPVSAYKNTEEFIEPCLGSGVEVAVAWNERVIGDYHFHRQGVVSVGSGAQCDIPVPLLNSFVEKVNLLEINGGVAVSIPVGMSASLIKKSATGEMEIKEVEAFNQKFFLNQNEMLYVFLSDDLKLIVRPSQQPMNPKLIPFVDISSDGFLSLAFSVVVALIIALAVQLNPTPDSLAGDEEIFPTPLFIQSPERVAKILNLPKPKVDLTKPNTPKVAKGPEKPKNPTATKISKIKKTPGNKTKPSSLAKNNNNTKNRVGSTVPRGKAVKVAKNRGAQAKSPDVKKSGIFSTFGIAGKNSQLDQSYSGPGQLAGLANQATNSAGENIDRPGQNFGSKFRQAGSNANGRNNVGVEGLPGNGELGPGLGSESLGAKKSVSIIPSGEGAVFDGVIDREGIRQVFFDNSRALRSCYERTLNQNTKLAGKLVLDFDIGQGGRVVGRPSVSRAASSFYNAELANCITSRLSTWTFPDPPRNRVVNVLYPLAFSSK